MFGKDSGNDLGTRVLVAACSVALASLAGSAMAMGGDTNRAGNMDQPATTTGKAARDEGHDAQRQIDHAAKVVQRMRSDHAAARLLRDAKGVFIVTKFGRAALGVGGRGGEGVLMVSKDGSWGDPAFYNMGGVSVGAEAGAEGGSLVFVLNDEKALKSFDQNNNWSLNAEAGLTIVNWSGAAQGSAGRGDVTVWSDTKGLLGAVAVSVTDIQYDHGETSAFYGKPMRIADVFNGHAQPKGSIAELRDALASATTASTHARNALAANLMRNASASASPRDAY